MLRRFSLVKTTLELTVLGVIIVAALNYQFVLDQYALATFKPSTQLAAIEGRLQLTAAGRALLYRAEPQINDKATFNRNCGTTRGQLELGCYYRNHIFVLTIENPNLAPEMDVVTAHELLHAAWTRLSSSERAKLKTELERVYATLNDSELRERMASYAKTEPGEEANELHSILATEYAQLSPMLEAYYKRYFSSRQHAVAAHAAYQRVFDDRRRELEADLASIRSLKGQLAVINRQLDAYKAAGQISQYNALVPRQNSLVDTINRRIEAYQRGVDEYNALSRSLDSQQITETEAGVQ